MRLDILAVARHRELEVIHIVPERRKVPNHRNGVLRPEHDAVHDGRGEADP